MYVHLLDGGLDRTHLHAKKGVWATTPTTLRQGIAVQILNRAHIALPSSCHRVPVPIDAMMACNMRLDLQKTRLRLAANEILAVIHGDQLGRFELACCKEAGSGFDAGERGDI